MAQGLTHQWAAVVEHRGVRQLALPGHGADLDPAALGVPHQGYPPDSLEVDGVARLRNGKVQTRHCLLSAGQVVRGLYVSPAQ